MHRIDYNSISPQKIRLYLSSRGWEKLRSETKFDIYKHPSYDNLMVVPNDKNYDDYAKRVGELVNDLALLYDENKDVIFAGMTISIATDIIEYHYEPQSGEIGLIPIQDLIKILEAGQKINLYGLRDAVDYKPYYPNSKWSGKTDLNDVRVGPTIPGSYIVQFIYPGLESKNHLQETIEGGIKMDNPNLRILCDKIEKSITEIIDVAERNKTDLDPELCISYNFVSSIMDLKFDNADVSVHRFKTINTDCPSKSLDLSRPLFRNISKIEENMRPPSMNKQYTVIGRLIQLNDTREQTNDGPVTMKIKYMDPEDDKILTASFEVDGTEADIAYDAAKKRENVSITGKIVGTPRIKRIEDITDFRVVK